jgi:hypothetical protein
MAAGGIVSSPTLAMIREAGPEAVVPLSGRGGAGETHVHFNNYGVLAAHAAEDWVVKMMDRAARRGRLGAGVMPTSGG